tara:strand:+ start:3390 stop:4082 length:693 start_codon:yes stop_codon:yes gene_type:complete
MGYFSGPNMITDGLVFAIDAGSTRSYPGSGTSVDNLVGANTGALENGVGFTSTYGGEFVFDGVDQNINIGVGTGINQLSGDFTVSIWARRTSASGNTWGNLFGDYYTNTTATTNEWQIMMSSASQIFVYRVPSYVINATSSGFPINTWINVVMTRIGTTLKLYANSNLIATTTNSGDWGTSTGDLNMGTDGDGSSEPFPGEISAVQVYDQGLTAAEVLQNYNAQKSRYGL